VKLAAWENKKARLPFLDVGPKFSKRTFYRSIHSIPCAFALRFNPSAKASG
jgi:hypothetical protein